SVAEGGIKKYDKYVKIIMLNG
ncbi:MAG: hypothetical protein UR60_C0006G0001, partial [Candidatus Moranbacteria bacterium GW2011_GWF2_34_56]